MAAVANSAKSIPPPSSFAALLRRSRFASYDPQIGQVYTSFGGDAHRGNYGLKRPLALRKRESYMRISAIDSRQQQTEWDHGEKEVRWMKKFGEVGRTPRLDHNLWNMANVPGQIQLEVDSEFAPKSDSGRSTGVSAEDSKFQPNTTLTLNTAAMSPKQFKRHLQKLRAMRPAFQEYIQDFTAHEAANSQKMILQKQKPHVKSTILLEQSKADTPLLQRFLSYQTQKDMESSDVRVIEQQLHPHVALSYSQQSDLQHFFLKKAMPGRVIDSGKNKKPCVAFAGMTAELDSKGAPVLPMDWEKLAVYGFDSQQGFGNFRVSDVKVGRAPVVVGRKPEGLSGMVLHTTVSLDPKVDMMRENPHMPWSRVYTAHLTDGQQPLQPIRKKKDFILSKVQDPAAAQDTRKRLLDILKGISEY